MGTPTHMKVAPLLAAIALALMPTAARGQGDGVDVMEIARQIRRNMINVEESLLELGGAKASEAGKQAAKDLEKLADPKARDRASSDLKGEINRRGQQVVTDIDAMIKSFKASGSGSGQQQQGEGQKKKDQQDQQPQSRDRNKSEQSGGKPEEKPGKQPQESKQKGKQEDNTKPNEPDGNNQQSSDRDYPDKDRTRHVNLEKKWGVLPPEQRQRLIDRNFRDFTPEYEREINAYFKKIARRR